MRSPQLSRLTTTTRVVVVVAVLAPVLWHRDLVALGTLAVLALVWTAGEASIGRPGIDDLTVIVAESFATGVLVALGAHTEITALAALVVPPFVAGLHRTLRGVLASIPALVLGLAATTVLVIGIPSTEVLVAGFSWTVGAVGLGMVALFVRSTVLTVPGNLAPYLHTQRLLRELADVSGALAGTLEVEDITAGVLTSVRKRLSIAASAVYLPCEGLLDPLGIDADASEVRERDLRRCAKLAHSAWSTGDVVVLGRGFAWPLGQSAVVAGSLSEDVDPEDVDLEGEVELLDRELTTTAVQLDTALLYATLRESVVADERRRLSREIHDGAAHGVASLGDQVDALIARSDATGALGTQLAALRHRVGAVAKELRYTALALHSPLADAAGLAPSILAVARGLEQDSGVRFEVSIEPGTVRLPRSVEAEVFGIVQEAMTNAARHSGARRVMVTAEIDAPRVIVVVADDGNGLGNAPASFQGLRIMRERAALLGAALEIGEPDAGGVRVELRLTSVDPDPPVGRDSVGTDRVGA